MHGSALVIRTWINGYEHEAIQNPTSENNIHRGAKLGLGCLRLGESGEKCTAAKVIQS